MSKVRTVLGCCIPVVLVAIALMTPAIAQAGSIKIWPDQLRPMVPNADYAQSVTVAVGGVFYASLTIPVGGRITKITYYHSGDASPASTSLAIGRVKMGSSAETVGYQSSTDSTGAIIPVDVALTGDSVIRAGYRYFIQAISNNENSYFLGVKINYQE